MERIEVKTFTKMSKNSIVDYKDLINYAKKLGQKAIAITDYNNVSIFPKIEKYIKDFKVIYGSTVFMLENDFIIPITIIVRNQKGLKNLYKIISRIKTINLKKYDKQIITRNELVELSDGLLYGLDALEMKLIYENQTDKQIISDILWYDFIEIKPTKGDEEYIKRIAKLAVNNRKIVIATNNVSYLKPEEKEDYEMLFPKQKDQDRYLKSTKEMLDDFKFLNDNELISDIVINNTNKLASLVDDIKINLNNRYFPIIKTSKNKLLDMVYKEANKIYGNSIPELIQKRLNEELYGDNGIINLQYENIFLINQKLVEYSNSLGYPVCARGNISSSLIAYLIGITNINPLPPHYYCSNCKKIIFINDDICGLDLPNKKCSLCKKNMKKDGFNIPYNFISKENVPNININYSINIEKELNKYLINMFGKNKVFKSGVIGVRKEKDAQQFIDNLDININEEKKKILASKLVGTIKTIGQNPGGLFIIPKGKSIYDFTPLAFPCNNKNYNKVTYFDYHYLNNIILKINMLFHDSVTMLKELAKYHLMIKKQWN